MCFRRRIQKVITQNEKLKTANDKVTQSYNALGASISAAKVKIALLVVALKKVARVMADWVTESNAYVENLNLFRVSMREGADEVLDFANKVNLAFGVDPSVDSISSCISEHGNWFRNSRRKSGGNV